MQNTTQPRGLFPRLRAALLGPQSARLTERLHATHWLSYLLVITQSVAVVLVLGHSLLVLLMTGDWFTRGVAALGLFVLVSAVYAADMALIATMRRLPALLRNRATWALYEHVAYIAFVLVIEASTFGIVAAILDTDPRAITGPKPLIPTHGIAFLSQIVCRAVLVAWTAVQLFIIAGKLPPQLSTLLATGKEIVGGHVQRQLSTLDMSGATLAAAFAVYAAMSKPPRRIQTWLNGWLVRRDAHREAEEERQAALVLDALHAFEEASRGPARRAPFTILAPRSIEEGEGEGEGEGLAIVGASYPLMPLSERYATTAGASGRDPEPDPPAPGGPGGRGPRRRPNVTPGASSSPAGRTSRREPVIQLVDDRGRASSSRNGSRRADSGRRSADAQSRWLEHCDTAADLLTVEPLMSTRELARRLAIRPERATEIRRAIQPVRPTRADVAADLATGEGEEASA